MDNKLRLKVLGWFFILMMVLNLVLFAFGMINWIVFWGVIILGALFVWKGLPWLKKKF